MSTVTLSLPTPYAVGRVNAYLLRGEPLTLIDAGPNYGDAREALIEGLAAEGVALSDIELLLLTHQHTDHEGLAGLVREQSGCVVAAHRDIVDYLSDMPSSLRVEDGYQAEMMRLHGVGEEVVETLLAVSNGYHRFGASVTIDRPLADGDVIDAGRPPAAGALPSGAQPERHDLRRRRRGHGILGRPSARPHLVEPRRPQVRSSVWRIPVTGRRPCRSSSTRSHRPSGLHLGLSTRATASRSSTTVA